MFLNEILKRQENGYYHLYTWKDGDKEMKTTVMTEEQVKEFLES